jgi:hypothetical protein
MPKIPGFMISTGMVLALSVIRHEVRPEKIGTIRRIFRRKFILGV